MFEQDDEDDYEKPKRSSGAMSLKDKMSLWGKLSDNPSRITNNDELFQGIEEVEEQEEESTGNPMILQYSQTILSSQAYDWLIASILKQSSYQWDTSYPQTMFDHIQKPILQSLPKGIISRKKCPDKHRVAFWLPWHPIRLRIEEEAIEKSSTISNFVALVGSSVDQIQAITIKRYIEQTWVSGGVEILDAIQQVVDQRASPRSES